MKVGLNQVAKLAGVGIATVDRVINERGSVSPATAEKVIQAARQLGIKRVLPTPYRRTLRFEIILARRGIPFFARLGEAFENLIPTLDRTVVLQRSFVDEAKTDLAEMILRTKGDAIVVCGQESAAVVDAVASVTSAGIPVITMVSDLPTTPRLAYVGIDHYRAGRAAAFFMARMTGRQGSIILLCDGFAYRAQSERISGFRDGFSEYSKHGSIATTIEGRGDERLTRELLTRALREFPDPVGIYNSGTANLAVEQAVDLSSHTNPLTFIGHDLTEDVMRMLDCGAMTIAIGQNPDLQARRAIDILLSRFGVGERTYETPTVPFTIHVRDNFA